MRLKLLAFSTIYFFLSSTLFAQDLIIYPSNNQTPQQQSSDEGECFVWSRDNSGFDPLASTANVTSNDQRRGGAVRGAVRGAAVGAIVGDDSDDVRDAARAGATVGIIRQGRQNRRAEGQQEQALADIETERANYNRYYKTCMEGRGYAVN